MELVIIVLAIIFSIWSEVNKKKKESDLDFDFSDLSSIEDFVKNKSPTPGSSGMHASNAGIMGSTTLEKQEKRQKKSRKKRNKRKEEIDASSLELPPLKAEENLRSASSGIRQSSSRPDDNNFAFNRKTLIQAFILSEAMNRYDINRIYERVPDVRRDDE